ncbi:hypothetical protein MMC13_006166 [Lambiella insularis]|nr:hypothetical protein [Lambiella insularis]
MFPKKRFSWVLIISILVLFPLTLYLMLQQHRPLTKTPPILVDAVEAPRLLEPLSSVHESCSCAVRTSAIIHDGVAPPSNITRVLVVPQTSKDSTGWIDERAMNVNLSLYVVDNPITATHPPVNKGHEVMVYLTYIIDHYEQLPDIVIFIHAHRHAWHNVDLLDFDAAEMVKRLNSERVTRYGYMNLRCSWDPGCPVWLQPQKKEELLGKQEQTLLAKSWSELFPLDPLPRILAQPCCAQFAVSKQRILSIPHGRFVIYRDWLLRTPLTDYFSGRIWEFVWQYVFTGCEVFCPLEHACYCDGYGLCFGGQAQYAEFVSLQRQMKNYTEELTMLRKEQRNDTESSQISKSHSDSDLDELDLGRETVLTSRIRAIEAELHSRKAAALDRGESYQNRADGIHANVTE